jgi:RNA polymerase sigma factor (sigma-70 family)
MRAQLEQDFEDLVENVISRLYERYKSLKIEKILPYAYGALDNEIKDYWKKKSRDRNMFTENDDQLPDLAQNDKTIEDKLIDQDLLHTVKNVLKRLNSDKKKKIFQLRLQGFNNKEIMNELNLSRSAYDTIVFRATRDIKKYLAKRGISG